MAWVTIAIISAAISGFNAILDSHLLSRKLPSLNSYLLPLGIFHFIVAAAILIAMPFPARAGALPVLAAFSTGLLGGLASIMTLNAIRFGEVSRIIPVVYTSPLFVALAAVPLFHERLTGLDWTGISLTVAGAVLISVQKSDSSGKGKMQGFFWVLVLCSLMSAAGTLLLKYATESLSFWNVYGANAITLAVIFIVFSARRETVKEIGAMPQRNRLMGLAIFNQATVVVAILLSVLAIQRGPVALVSTVTSSRPAFVFVYAAMLSLLFPSVLNERLTKGTAAVKFTATAMIVGGIAAITL